MKFLRLLPLFAVAAIGLAVTAFAQTTGTTVEIPIGDWVKAAGGWVGPILGAAVLFLIRKLPPQIAAILTTLRVDQLLDKALSFAINKVAGASHDKPMTIDVGNKVLAEALDYAIRHGAPAIIQWMGGADMIREKLLARLKLDAQAAA